MIDGLPDATCVRLELFPAEITGIDGLPDAELKAVATDTYFFVLGPTGAGVGILFSAALDSYAGYNVQSRGWEMVLEGGQEVFVSKASSCGCGSRLRSYRIYPSLRRVVS